MAIAESVFVPREKLLEKLKYFQNIEKHTYLKGRYDRITSVAIPWALAASCFYMIVNYIMNTLLSFHMVVAFLMAVILDNTVPGSRQERGVHVLSDPETARR